MHDRLSAIVAVLLRGVPQLVRDDLGMLWCATATELQVGPSFDPVFQGDTFDVARELVRQLDRATALLEGANLGSGTRKAGEVSPSGIPAPLEKQRKEAS